MPRILAMAVLLSAMAIGQTAVRPGRGRGRGGDQTRTPVIVELFTSESCSSCPPADEVLSRLDREQPVSGVEVIALSEHVDYWNQLGWQDRFSSPLFSGRQQDYGQLFHLQSVYTPQMVVNGQAQTLGSDWSGANRAVRAAAQNSQATVRIAVRGGDTVQFSVNRLPEGTRSADMMLAVTESNLETAVAGGENTGRRLLHTGVVRSLTTLGRLDSRKDGAYTADARLNLNPQWNRSNLKLVLFVQDPGNRHILGAATAHP
jgi:hypothetical protein